MASSTQWTWVWVDSRSWWQTGRPRVLQFMGSQRVGHDWVTELNWTLNSPLLCNLTYSQILKTRIWTSFGGGDWELFCLSHQSRFQLSFWAFCSVPLICLSILMPTPCHVLVKLEQLCNKFWYLGYKPYLSHSAHLELSFKFFLSILALLILHVNFRISLASCRGHRFGFCPEYVA